MEVTHLMKKFRVGQKVLLKSYPFSNLATAGAWEKWKNVVFIVERPGNVTCLVRCIQGIFHFELKNLKPFAPICPVCEQEIKIESKKIREHYHNDELCYGSYTPYEES